VLVLMLSMLLSVTERSRYAASKALMPVNFAILAGGMLTSIGTATNLLVLSLANDLGMAPMGLFGFAEIALVALAVAIPYPWLVAPRLLPKTSTTATAHQHLYAARIVVTSEGDPLAGRTLASLARTIGRDFPGVAGKRRDETLPVSPELTLEPGDAVLIQDTSQGLRDLASALKVELFERTGDVRFVESADDRVYLHLAELAVGGESDLLGRSLRESGIAERHGIVVVGVSRRAAFHLRRGADPADVPIHIAAFAGVVAMLLAGCVKLEGIGHALSLEDVLLVTSSVALGQALVATGAAQWIAGGAAAVATLLAPPWQLAMFMAFAALLTNCVSNTAAAAVGTLIALATAAQLGAPLEPYVLAVLFGANHSFATPMACQTNILALNVAGYRFADFLRVGVPLVGLMLVTLALSLGYRYGLT
jgi:di/tricarboxylate transporter